MLRSLEAFLFQMNRDNGGNSIDFILVGKKFEKNLSSASVDDERP